jgi:iron complex outermembrane receptor protein
MTERAPRKLTWGASLTGYGQRFDQYGDEDDYGGGQASGYIGTRLHSGLWGALTFNHQDSTSQPMQYFAVSADAAGLFPSVTAPATAVSGIQYDTDHRGARRAVFGSHAGAIDHTVQDSLKLRLGVALATNLEASALLAGWRSDTRNRNVTFLRDAAGREVWQGAVTDGVNTFDVPASAFAPSTRDERHRQLGFTLKSTRPSGWNGSAIVSDYRMVGDAARQANTPEPMAAAGGAGSVTRRDGTGWRTFEAQASYTPREEGRHALTVGVHRNAYLLDNLVNDASDWRTTETALNQRYQGETAILAFYAQDAWKLSDTLKLTVGLRAEHYRTWNGHQQDGRLDKSVAYPRRTLSGYSPKASLAWTASQHLLLRASFGRGVRFPNVEELYNGTITATAVTLSDPRLKAERSNALEVSAETFWGKHSLRTSVFHDEVEDAILRQSDTTVTPSITNVSNVDRVRTSGIELVWTARDFGIRGLSVEANGAWTDSKVVENARDPQSEDKYWLRVPRTRAGALVAYRPTDKWMGSLGWRHQGRAYSDVYNLDVNPGVYGGVSRLNQLDARLSYKPQAILEVAIGIDNVTNGRAYQVHPFPARTIYVSLRTSSR